MAYAGTLLYNKTTERMDIRCADGTEYGGLHCGECLEIKINGGWVQTRIESNADDAWYLVGFPRLRMEGLEARVGC